MIIIWYISLNNVPGHETGFQGGLYYKLVIYDGCSKIDVVGLSYRLSNISDIFDTTITNL